MRSRFESEKMGGVDIAEDSEGLVLSSSGGRLSGDPKLNLGTFASRDEYR